MELTAPRRSQLLQTLLQQQVQPQPNIRSGGELLAKLLAQGVRQSQINRMQEQEAASKKTEQANVAQVLSKLGGDPADMNFMGNPVTDESGRPQNNISLAQALGQLPVDNPVANAISGQMIQQHFAVPKDIRTTAQKEYDAAVKQGFSGTFLDYKKAVAKAGRSSVVVNSAKPPSGFRYTEDGQSLEPIPGGPGDTLSPTEAAKVQLVESAMASHQEFQKFIVNEDGAINRINIGNMNVRMPFTDGRSANVLLLDSIEAKLRAESGAAVPKTEVDRAGKRFRPSLLDNDETIMIKMRLMDDFLNGAFNKMNRDGRFDVIATIDAVESAADEAFATMDAVVGEQSDADRLEALGFDPQ